MLVTLGKRAPRDRPTPVGLLADCHERIRSHISLATRLVHATSRAELSEAAARVHRYFSVGLPLHVADEEESVRPRLPACDALALMTAEHVEIEERLAQLVPVWSQLASSPDATVVRVIEPARILAQLLDRHLASEESNVFPAIAGLNATEQRAIVDEMRSRRR